MNAHLSAAELWPALPWEEWQDTATTLHMWTQIVGKTRLALTPLENHWWNVPLYVTPRGLSTSSIPYRNELFDLEFDFVDHRLQIRLSSGGLRSIALRPQSVAAFYREYLELLRFFNIDPNINPKPVEVADPIPFADDHQHASYDKDAVYRFWRILQRTDTLFKRFRARFIGKCSPVHFFWGSFDLAVTRFSGRTAPARPGADAITREAYSHEVISAGFWPGNGGFGAPAFYCYAAPPPIGLEEQPVRPKEARYNPELKEFILKYEDVRRASSPDDAVLQFLQSSYEAAAGLAGWDRPALERSSNATGKVHSEPDRYITARAEPGLLVIHSSPVTLSLVPRDVENDAYNVGGVVTVGTFTGIDEAKHAAMEQYSVPAERWQVSEVFPLDVAGEARTENHSPEIDGHKLVRHDIHWK